MLVQQQTADHSTWIQNELQRITTITINLEN